jgi:hypothetical protein
MSTEKREFKLLHGVSNLERQRNNAGSTKTNAAFSANQASYTTEYVTISGIAANNPIPFDISASDFVISDNYEATKDSNGSFVVVYYYSIDKCPELQPPSEEVLNLPESDPQYKLFLASLAQGIGGGRIILDTKEKLPNRGDKIVFQSIRGDHAYPSTIVSIEQTTNKSAGDNSQGSSLKDQASEGYKLRGSPGDANPEEEGEDYNPDKNAYQPYDPKDKKLKINFKLPADKLSYSKGYNRTSLREDVAEDYKKLYNEVKSLGGKITSAGGYVVKGVTSFHSLGLAFDMALDTGMQDIDRDQYIITRNTLKPNTFITWCKTDNEKVPIVKLQAVICKGTGKNKSTLIYKDISVRAFNFNEIAEKHGFTGISSQKGFVDGNAPYTACEWWHFQSFKGLKAGVSTFGNEALKIYTEEEALKKLSWFDQTRNLRYATGYWHGTNKIDKSLPNIAEMAKQTKEKKQNA